MPEVNIDMNHVTSSGKGEIKNFKQVRFRENILGSKVIQKAQLLVITRPGIKWLS